MRILWWVLLAYCVLGAAVSRSPPTLNKDFEARGHFLVVDASGRNISSFEYHSWENWKEQRFRMDQTTPPIQTNLFLCAPNPPINSKKQGAQGGSFLIFNKTHCDVQCKDGQSCGGRGCGCEQDKEGGLFDPFPNLSSSELDGTCYGGRGELWKTTYHDNEVKISYCILPSSSTEGIPLYILSRNQDDAGYSNYTFTFWKPGIPSNTVFNIPPYCNC